MSGIAQGSDGHESEQSGGDIKGMISVQSMGSAREREGGREREGEKESAKRRERGREGGREGIIKA